MAVERLTVRRVLSFLSAGLLALLALAAPAAAQNRALIVIIDAFRDPALAIDGRSTASGDGAAMRRLLLDTLKFKPDEIKLLRGSQATREAILQGITDWLRPDKEALEERRRDEEKIKAGKLKRQQVRALRRKWAKARRKPARSYFYFAGPGYVRTDIDGDEADGFDEAIVPYDATAIGSGSNRAVAGIITDDELTAAIQTLEGRHVTVVLDTAFAHPLPASAPAMPQGPWRRVLRLSDYAGPAQVPTPAPGSGDARLVETRFREGSLAVWAAAGSGEGAFTMSTPLNAGEVAAKPDVRQKAAAKGKRKTVPGTGGASAVGVFTRAIVRGLEGAADANANKTVAAPELLFYLRLEAARFCATHGTLCAAGPTPRLYPVSAYGLWTGKGRRFRGPLTLSTLADFLIPDREGQGAAAPVAIERSPAGPLKVGTEGVSFRVTAPRVGNLLVLNLSAKGHLSQLYPNHFMRRDTAAALTRVKAEAPLAIPAAGSGLQFTVTDPGKNHVIALFTPDDVPLGEVASAHSIGNIPRSEAVAIYLPRLAAALLKPVADTQGGKLRPFARWSVTTLSYDIIP
ncbi:MAG: hypothetical protein Kow0032_00300 [Methyloligellaceae bacterium]